jgi:predicted dehydrogenase
MVGFNLRWHRLARQARELIQRGVLGSLEFMASVSTTGIRHRQNVSEWRKRRELGGGTLFEDAAHYFDLSRFLFQSDVEEVSATSRSEHWDDVTGSVTFRMANDVLVTSVFSEATSPCKEIQIYGQAGCLRLSLYRFDGLEFVPLSSAPGDVRTRLRSIIHSLKELPQAVLDLRQGGEQAIMFKAQWRHFIDSIQRDTAPECTLEDGRHALQAALAAVESASTGRVVRVAQASREITPVVLE